ncbi:hypothetical protein GQ600_18846 [Phytophthora cactorum]|nr:hypothetical protein GQ600_18846 [Phytophthora cactorum]
MSVKLPSEAAQKVVAELRQHFVVNGVAPVSHHDIDTRIADLRAIIAMSFRSAMGAAQIPTTDSNTTSVNEQREWRPYEWGDGKLAHAAPKDWAFPARASVKSMDARIRPYRTLSKQHDIKSEHQMRHSRVRVVMQYFEQLAKEYGALSDGVSGVSALQLSADENVFDIVFAKMLSQLYTAPPKRAEDLSCGTIYNRLTQYR